MFVLKSNGKTLDLTTPKVMGILNVTPDSFYDGGKFSNIKNALVQVEKMIEEGASIIDIGAMSSRPNSDFVNVQEELKRVLPIVQSVRKSFSNIFISVDTFRSEVADAVLKEGVDIINDISAGDLDEKILKVVAEYNTPYIFMHMKGIPKNMQNNPVYNNVVGDVLKYLINKIRSFKALGIKQLIADPGFGFGKTIEDNYKLLNDFDVFKILEIPILAGISRKSMLYKYLEITPENSLNATTAANTVALQKGAKILRVHDVKEAVEAVRLYMVLTK